MTTRQDGFTLIELLIVLTIIAIIASVAIPNLLVAKRNANESAAIATLKAIAAGQAQLQAGKAIDTNTNGFGEFGYLSELAGGVGVRNASGSASNDYLRPALLSPAFKNISTDAGVVGGMARRSGYRFQLYLPNSAKAGIPEADAGGVNTPAPDALTSESLWCCYAWPTSYGTTGTRAFFINQSGEVLGTSNRLQRYSGELRYPRYWSAYQRLTANLMGSTIAANATAWDLQRWNVLN